MAGTLPLKVGLVGCGHISSIYLKNCRALPNVEVVACADLDTERARERAREFDVRWAGTLPDLLARKDVDIVLNLTVPAAHAEVTLSALRAGKHVYSEKPLAITRDEGRCILSTAREQNLLVGCAPDTFMGAGVQTARALLDRGDIGEPVGATAFFLSDGLEDWHPNPEFFYQPGAGPLFDMGPYYLTTLIVLLGSVQAVASMARITFPERTIRSQPLAGTTFQVRTPTYVSALLEFSSGPVGTLISTFDVRHHTLPYIEVYGSEGNMRVPDPNRFSGPVLVRGRGDSEWREAASDSPYTANWRGIGLNDMAGAIASGGLFRANAALGFHVLDIMESILAAADSGRTLSLESDVARPAPFPTDIVLGS